MVHQVVGALDVFCRLSIFVDLNAIDLIGFLCFDDVFYCAGEADEARVKT